MNVAQVSLSTDEEIDTLGVTELGFGKDIESMSDIREGDMEDLENPSELGLFEEFIGVASAASERLAPNYNLTSVREELQYLKDFDAERISSLDSEGGDPRSYVEQISGLADNVNDYLDRTGENFGEETFTIKEVFESFENYGDVNYSGAEDLEVSGDESLCVVANTIAENALDHGSIDGEKPDIYAGVEECKDFYRIDVWDDGGGLPDGFDEEEIFRRDIGENSGLGLYLGREITELFGGNLEYSDKNAGREGGFGLEWTLKKPREVSGT